MKSREDIEPNGEPSHEIKRNNIVHVDVHKAFSNVVDKHTHTPGLGWNEHISMRVSASARTIQRTDILSLMQSKWMNYAHAEVYSPQNGTNFCVCLLLSLSLALSVVRCDGAIPLDISIPISFALYILYLTCSIAFFALWLFITLWRMGLHEWMQR